jgi:glycosyltransferase involved in cell wall biosynthesis
MDPPAISVVLTVRNGMPYLPRALDSVLAQSFTDFELVVVDDGSTDDSRTCINSYPDRRVRLLTPGRLGRPGALNHGLYKARGALVALMDADDLALLDRFARQRQYLHDHPACAAVGCQAEDIDRGGHVTGERRFPVTDRAIRWQMVFGSPLLHSGAMVRRQAVLAVGGYHPDTSFAEDYLLWSRLAAHGRLANLPAVLARYRIHEQSTTARCKDDQIESSSRISANYARSLSPATRTDVAEGLYQLYATGRERRHVSPTELARHYRSFLRVFLDRHGPLDGELAERVYAVQEVLRWRCRQQVRHHWSRPRQALPWLRFAAQLLPGFRHPGRPVHSR